MIKKLDFKNKEKGKETTVFLKRDDIKTMKKDIVKLGELGFQIERERISGFKPKESMAVEEAEAIKEEKAEEEIEIEAPRGIAEEEKKEEEEEPTFAKATVGKEEKEEEEEEEEEKEKEKRRLAEEEEAKERAVREEERKKLAEEEAKERAAREEERKKQEKLSAEKAEEQRLINIDKEIEDIAPEKAALNKEKGQFLTEIKSFETQLEPILEEEKLIENKILEMEELEKITPLEKRSQIEKKRWEADAKRRDLEKTKWSIQEKIEKVKEKIKDLELKYQGVLKGEDELKEEKEKILQKRQEERLIQEKSRLKNEIFQIIDEKKIIENKENELLAKKNRIETELKELLEEEQTTEEVIRDIERKEKEISDPEEQKKIEKSRWKIEDDRKTLETKRWELEQEKKDLSAELKKVEKEEQEILKKENPLRERLKEIDRLLKISPEEAPEEEALEEEAPGEEAPEEEEERKEEERKEFEEEAIEPEEKVAAKAPTPKFGGERQVEVERAKEKEEEEEEERRRLIEEEIKKRIAKEAERRQEENLLAKKKRFLEKNQKEINEEEPFFENLEAEEDKFSSSPFAAARVIEKETPETLIPRPPKKPSLVQKILIRILIIAIILLVIGFFYWFFVVKKPEIPEEIIIPPSSEEEIEEELPPTEEEIIEEPEIIIPASLISVNATETLEIMNSSEIPQLLSQIIKKSFETEGHIRLLFKNVTENKIVGLKEFFDAFEVKTPEGLFEKLNNDFTLFIFSSQGLNRLGFVTKIKEKENLVDLTLSWEPTMEKDTEKLFEVLGKEEPALSSVFKNSLYQETSFRFLTVSREDFGICYTLFNDYFVFASSFESMKKTIDLTKAAELENQISQLFIVGFDGTTLTPQLEEFFHKYKPGGVLLLSKNIENREQLKKLTEDLQNLSLRETGLPLFIAVDQEGGIISRVDFLQEKTPQSEIKSSNEAYQVGLTRGQELKELGINLNLAPLLDAAKEGDFLFNRSFQKNAAEAGNLAKSLIEGQKNAGIFTAIKHFPGYGGISFNPEESLAKVETLPEISQFKKAIEANPEFVMAANAVYKNLDPSLPFIFSPTAIQFLKNNLGSKIAIVTDDLAQNYLLENFSLKDIMLKPIQAGANILIFSGWEIDVPEGLNVFFDAFKKGEISQAKIKEAISKIIKIKESLM